MAFVPTLTPAQRQIFAQRLWVQLSAPQSRAYARGVHHAFACAAGYTGSYELHQAIDQNKWWVRAWNRFTNRTHPSSALMVPWSLPPHLVRRWAQQTWLHHQLLLRHDPFDVPQVQHLLAALWGHPYWEQASTLTRPIHSPSATAPGSSPLYRLHGASISQQLANLCASQSHRPNSFGWHWHWNPSRPAREWRGIDTPTAQCHTLLVCSDPVQRVQQAIQWTLPRLHSGDRVIVWDASGETTVLHQLRSACIQSHRSCQTWTWKGSGFVGSEGQQWSADALLQDVVVMQLPAALSDLAAHHQAISFCHALIMSGEMNSMKSSGPLRVPTLLMMIDMSQEWSGTLSSICRGSGIACVYVAPTWSEELAVQSITQVVVEPDPQFFDHNRWTISQVRRPPLVLREPKITIAPNIA